MEDLELLFSLAIENAENVHKSSFSELALESMVIILATTDTTVPINDIIGRIENLSGGLGKTSVDDKTEEEPASQPAPAPSPTDLGEQQPLKQQKEEDNTVIQTFTSFVKSKNTILGLHLEKADSVIEEEQAIKFIFNDSTINYEYLKKRNAIDIIKSLAGEFYNTDLNIRVELNKTGHEVDAEPADEETQKNVSAEDPVVSDAINIFDGKILKNKGR